MKYCYSCFNSIDDYINVCPYCGKPIITEADEPIYLAPGTLLNNRYIIGETVGAGGFGVIYKAFDTTLSVVVAVKEFFVSRLVTRAPGETNIIYNKKSMDEFNYRKDRFLAEARTMAQFGNHKNIVNVYEFFEENNTAYIIMELLQGVSLNDYLKEHGKLDKELALFITNEIGASLRSLHDKKIIHRDVAPDNIYICQGSDLKIKLLDLGAAKLPDSSDDVIDIILKPGYSPNEQYDNTKNIGPWSDIYALGATLYVMLTGIKPDESTNRKQEDKVIPPMDVDPSISENLSNTIMKSMAIDHYMRFKNINEFLNALNGQRKVISLKAERRKKRIIRAVEIVAVLAVLAVVALVLSKNYSDKKAIEELNPASLEVWYAVADGSNEERAMQAVFDDFMSKYPDVEIVGRAIPEDEYLAELQQAAATNSLPDIFESSGATSDVLSATRSLENVLNSDIMEECPFLDGYTNTQQIPLGISVPVAYVITNGNTSINYTDTTFSSLSDFGTDTDIAISDTYRDLIIRNYGNQDYADASLFLDNSENSVAVYLSSSMENLMVKSILTSVVKAYVVPEGNVVCDYIYFYSFGNSDNIDDERAADKLLSWMLGNTYQNYLMIGSCNDGQLPINDTAFNAKIANGDLVSLSEVYRSFTFADVVVADPNVATPTPTETPAPTVPMYTLTVEYVSAAGTIDTVTEEYEEDSDYSVEAPELDGYYPAGTTVFAGVMTEDTTITITYNAIPDTGFDLFLFRLYQNLFDRYPDPSGQQYYRSLLDGGATPEDIANSFYNSQEFTDRNVTDEEFIRELYWIYLGRPSSDADVAYWIDKLTNEGYGRSDLINGFIHSDEWATLRSQYMN